MGDYGPVLQAAGRDEFGGAVPVCVICVRGVVGWV